MENIHKIWGERQRIFLSNECEIDYLILRRNSFCSTHTHRDKINRFIVVSGKVSIETEYGQTTLTKGQSFDVHPPMKHKFVALEDSTMIEIAYVRDGRIDPKDIDREKQGGLIIEGVEYTIPELKEKGMLPL